MGTKALTTQDNNSRKNLEVIENYLCADDEDRAGMELTPKQLQLLDRWNFADDQLRRDRDGHQEIVNQIKKKFSVNESTAWDDLRKAQIVFGSCNALDKAYTSYAFIRSLQDDIRICKAAQDWKIVVELRKVLQKAIAAMKDNTAPKSARTIIFNIQPTAELTVTDAEVESAIKEAEAFLDYEEIKEDEGAP